MLNSIVTPWTTARTPKSRFANARTRFGEVCAAAEEQNVHFAQARAHFQDKMCSSPRRERISCIREEYISPAELESVDFGSKRQPLDDRLDAKIAFRPGERTFWVDLRCGRVAKRVFRLGESAYSKQNVHFA